MRANPDRTVRRLDNLGAELVRAAEVVERLPGERPPHVGEILDGVSTHDYTRKPLRPR